MTIASLHAASPAARSDAAPVGDVVASMSDGQLLDCVVPWFQPLVTSCGHRYGAETLARFNVAGNVVGPGAADRLAALVEDPAVTWRLLEPAIAAFSRWAGPGEKLTVNATVATVLDRAFTDTVGLLRARFGVALVVEVTENERLDHPLLPDALERLRDAGVGVAVDDFGTGHATVEQVRGLPIDVLKVAASVAWGSGSPDVSRRILDEAVAFGHRMQALVVVEGVESLDQARLAAGCGADVLQGFGLGRPGPALEVDPVPFPSFVPEQDASVSSRARDGLAAAVRARASFAAAGPAAGRRQP